MDYRKLNNWQKIPELAKLKDLSNPPKELFYFGNWDPHIFSDCVAVVGSRRITTYGKQAVEKIIPQLVFQKKTIVSGFMYGVDQYAHQVCVENGGKTIAVLGWGINYELAGFDLKLAKQIIKTGGLIISEWRTQKPTLWTFPARNRIVAALSREVIIIEAAAKSGSLITARIAEKLKRKIWAVPGPITSRTSVGTNNLIAQKKAHIWLPDIKPDLRLIKSSDPILDLLLNEGLTADEISRKLGKSIASIGAQLSLLNLNGQLVERGGKYYLNDAS